MSSKKYFLGVSTGFVALASLLWGNTRALAQEQPKEVKPIATISVAPLERTLPDLSYLLGAFNLPEMTIFFETATGAYSKGLDKSRPIGIAVSVGTDDDEQGPTLVACVPMLDHEKWFETLAMNGIEPEDLGEGVYEIAAPGAYVYGKVADGWFYAAQTEDALKNLPNDPLALVGDLPSRYTFAVRVDLEHLSAENRKQIFEQVQGQFEGNIAEQFGDQLPGDLDLKNPDEETTEQFDELIGEAQQILIGFLIDSAEKKIHADMAIQFMPNTKSASQIDAQSNLKSDLTAVGLPNSTINARIASVLATDEDKAKAKLGFQQTIEQISQGIASAGLSAERAELLKKLIASSTDIIEKTIDEGVVDAALSASFNDDVLKVLAGVHIVDGRAIESEIKEFIAGFAEESQIEVQSDYAKHNGWSLHRVQAKLPESESEIRTLLGDQIELYIAGSEKLLLVSLDPDGDATLKSTIDQMATTQAVKVSPIELSVHVGTLLKLAQKVAPTSDESDSNEESNSERTDQMLKSLLEVAEHIGTNDQVKMTTTTLPRGVVTRITVEEGVLKTFGSAVRKSGLMPGGAGF